MAATVTASTRSSSRSSSPLFKLPLEVRFEVYEFILLPQRFSYKEENRHGRLGQLSPFLHRSSQQRGCTIVLLLCWRIFEECQTIMRKIPQRLWYRCDSYFGTGSEILRIYRPPLGSAIKYQIVEVPWHDAINVEQMRLEVVANVSFSVFRSFLVLVLYCR